MIFTQITLGLIIPIYAAIRCLLAMTGVDMPAIPIYFESQLAKHLTIFTIGASIGYFWTITAAIWLMFVVGISILNVFLGGSFVNGVTLFGTLFDGLSHEQKMKKAAIAAQFIK